MTSPFPYHNSWPDPRSPARRAAGCRGRRPRPCRPGGSRPAPASGGRGRVIGRLSFDAASRIFDIDLSGISFEHSRDVNDIHDWLEQALCRAGGRWYFLVNDENTRIQSPAWVKFAARGKDLNDRFSLGSVRYAPCSETETDIRLRAESGGFRPNIRNTRAEALARIDEMKAAAARDVPGHVTQRIGGQFVAGRTACRGV
jgi:hypothetical protein